MLVASYCLAPASLHTLLIGAMCICALYRMLQDLGRAASRAKNYVGCTACPGGKTLQRIRPQMVAGSVFLQLQPEGKACY